MSTQNEKIQIQTERLLLRPLCIEDSKRVAIICGEESIAYNCLLIPSPYTEKDAIGFIESISKSNCSEQVFAIVLKNTDTLIGCIGIGKKNKNDSGELGYWLDLNYRRNGYMSEAATAILDYAFTKWGYHKVYATHFDFNENSGKVMQKIGMTYEGTLVDEVKKDDQYITLKRYAIVKS